MQDIRSKVVSVLDILRAYAEAYCKGTLALSLATTTISEETRNGKPASFSLLQALRSNLDELLLHCEQQLPMTAKAISTLIEEMKNPHSLIFWSEVPLALLSRINDVQTRLTDELSLNLFFRLPQEKKKYFDNPIDGWQDVIDRLPETLSNIEEMSKCFALSRYPAAVYHACQALESGLIQFGIFLEVVDPKSGWTAVTNRLIVLLEKTKRSDLPQKYQGCYGFLEQMRAVIQSLQTAWRNKIDHAQGRLALMTIDFTPDIAEEIMIASRSFLRRLATEMPP